jgi:hypothetical protein
VFFYGLFMDAGLLRARGIEPAAMRGASVQGFALRIGLRATLVPASGDRVFGVAMELTHDEIDRLYSDPSVQAYPGGGPVGTVGRHTRARAVLQPPGRAGS